MTLDATAAALLVDDFEEGSVNKLGGHSNTYLMEPSRALALRVKDQAKNGFGSLMLKYDKKAQGGPANTGGWCGWYTLLKTNPRYFDSTAYSAVTFWVKGASGGEDFVVGLADRHWDEVGDSVKSEPIGKYLLPADLPRQINDAGALPLGKITTEWQKAVIPLNTFLLDEKQLASFAVCFEGSIFPGGAAKGTIYIDDLAFE